MSSEVLRSSLSRTMTHPSSSILNGCKHIVGDGVVEMGVNYITYEISINVDRKRSSVFHPFYKIETKLECGRHHVCVQCI